MKTYDKEEFIETTPGGATYVFEPTIGTKELPCSYPRSMDLKWLRRINSPNLSNERTLRTPRSGWGAEDRTRHMLDFINVHLETNWRYEELQRASFPSVEQQGLLEGVVFACAFWSGAVSGGKLREMIINCIGPSKTELDPMAVQRLIETIERFQEPDNN